MDRVVGQAMGAPENGRIGGWGTSATLEHRAGRGVALVAVGERELGSQLTIFRSQPPVLVEKGLDALAQGGVAGALWGRSSCRVSSAVAKALDAAAQLGLLVEPLPGDGLGLATEQN